jgi:hypothetical protein
MLFAPAAMLVLRGNLSVNEALVRFGCALLFAMVGTAVVLSSLPAPHSTRGGVTLGQGQPDGSSATEESPGAPARLGVPGVPVTQPVG